MPHPTPELVNVETRHLRDGDDNYFISKLLFHTNDQGIAQIEITYPDGRIETVESFTGTKNEAKQKGHTWLIQYVKQWKRNIALAQTMRQKRRGKQ